MSTSATFRSARAKFTVTLTHSYSHYYYYYHFLVSAGSPSVAGDVMVRVFDMHQLSLPTPFHSVLVSTSVSMALSTVFHSINSPDNSPFSHSVLPGLISALLVLSTIYLFMKVSLSPDVSLCG